MFKLRRKDGVELSLNTMIIIVLALLVLVVLGYLFIKSVSNAGISTSCTTHQGDCVPIKPGCSATSGKVLSAYPCDTGEICCVDDPFAIK